MRKTVSGAAPMSRGTSLMLTAVLMPVLLGFVAVSIDTAVLATARAQLKTVADAAALAGALPLADENRVRGATDLSSEIATAQANAKATAQANKVLGQWAVILDNPSNSDGGDVVVGVVDSVSHLWMPPPFTNPALINSVLVTASRSSDHGGLVPSFFSRVLGFNGSTVSVQSIATVQNYEIKGYRSINNFNVNLLPIVLDQTTYNEMMAGTTTDQYTYNSSTNTVTSGPDGVHESKLYPIETGSPGNWGTVNIGVTNNSTSTLSAQIENGITPAQLATFPNSTIQLSSATNPPSISFSGNPGISAGIQSSLTSIIGKPVSIPIYTQVSGNGDNSSYTVVAFAAVRLVSVDFQGNPKYVIVQPSLINDPTMIVGSAQQSWTSGGVVRVNLSQ